ncbi:hypothetical protein [Streptomyces sp. SP18CS02]|nr:hypothetical protein [Streptomyces sp. SP18CS02]MEE1754844.1 hypothetical protein [Streptomyces sp. SP18CS02]
MDLSQAIEVLEERTVVPKDEGQRTELFAAFAVLHVLALGGSDDPAI